MASTGIDEALRDWSDIEHRFANGILIGNGASRAVWDGFSYDSLYDEAVLRQRDRDLFEAFNTTNFEGILRNLQIGQVVCENTGHATARISDQYARVRDALVDAVAGVHVSWVDVDDSKLVHLRRALRHYAVVFSTNYDLLAYWSIMSRRDGNGFVDFFWGPNNSFDLVDASARPGPTPILYLHGGLHLVRAADGSARKRIALTRNLLDAFRTSGDVPLFVSEGSSRDKMRAIRSSDYLTFAYENFVEEVDGLVVFGHSLSSQDAHIRNPLRMARRLAISIMPGPARRVIAAKAAYIQKLPGVRIDFFDARSHPLGDPSLYVTQ